ncbi:MAG: hypothetical protein WD231_04670 [Candidatus Woykebacteria bacterium]
MNRRQWRTAVATVVTAMVALLVVLIFMGMNMGDTDAQTTTTPTPKDGTPTPTFDCATGEGEWELQDLHGDGGRVLNDGFKSVDDLRAAAKHDPVVLHTLLLQLLAESRHKVEGVPLVLAEAQVYDEIPTPEELRCVDKRKEAFAMLDGILRVSKFKDETIGELANRLDINVENGQVIIANTFVSGGDQVGLKTDVKNADDKVLTILTEDGAETHLRKECGNKISPERPPALGKGRITVVKTDDGNNLLGRDLPVPGFRIIADGPQHLEGVTDGSGMVRFDDVEPGTYTVREVNQTGWEPVTPGKVTIRVETDQSIPARFKNQQVSKEAPSPTPKPTATNTPRPPGPTPTQTGDARPTSPPPCCPPAPIQDNPGGGTSVAPTFTPEPSDTPAPTATQMPRPPVPTSVP